ncbi:MAG TPA: MarR family transcriptional regulator [Firmicutes bacterium]|nr:MarR family transcriptional regulator [Bacillota bacterium]
MAEFRQGLPGSGAPSAAGTAGACARQVMELVPLIMDHIRAEMRRGYKNGLSVPQFRTLARVGRQPDASLSEVAEHIGVTLPTMSRIVDRLVERGLITRQNHPDSRRRLVLNLTAEGSALLESARASLIEKLTQRLETLSIEDRLTIEKALATLAAVLDGGLP